jgi:hypothetical protein
MKRVFLNNSATTLYKPPGVVEALKACIDDEVLPAR